MHVAMIGATGAVGGHALDTLLSLPEVARVTVLGRRAPEPRERMDAHVVDLLDEAAMAPLMNGVDAAICTLGVGEPTKASRDQFTRIDHDMPLAFARAARAAGARHFVLLGSVGADPRSPSFFLRSKGRLEEGLAALGFERLTLARPSMILTPENRYGLSQALTLAVWPKLDPVLRGPLRRLRGVPVAVLGRAIGRSVAVPRTGREVLHWPEIVARGGEAAAR